MADKIAGVEASAIGLLKQAIQMDSEKKFTEAIVCYQEGIQLLLTVLKGTTDEAKRQRIREKAKEYMDRAEKLKEAIEVEKQSGKYHEQMQIANGATGFSYEKIFGRLLEEPLTEVVVEDPYIRSHHQVYNFLRFCELLVKSKCGVKKICLVTGHDDPESHRQQRAKLDELARSLAKWKITLVVNYSTTLHDREIRFDSGWIIKIGRGLDIYKATEGKFSIGRCDFELRQCHETTVDIFHRKHTKPL